MGGGISTTAAIPPCNPNEGTPFIQSNHSLAKWSRARDKTLVKFVNATKGKILLFKVIAKACAIESNTDGYITLEAITNILNATLKETTRVFKLQY